MKKHVPWALVPWLLCAAPACVLQSESISTPSDSGWMEVEDGSGDIHTDARVGIGTTPTADLDVLGDAKATRYLVNDATFMTQDVTSGLAIWAGGVEALDVQYGGNVHVPVSMSVGGSLSVAGVCEASCTSDARLKKNVEPLHDALGRLLRLRGVTFDWIDPSAHGPRERGVQTGFIAQEVEAVFPDWVTEGSDGYRRLQIRGFEALAVEALRTVAAQNRELGGRVHALEASNARLSSEVRALRERDAQVKELADELASERRARAALEARLAALESTVRKSAPTSNAQN